MKTVSFIEKGDSNNSFWRRAFKLDSTLKNVYYFQASYSWNGKSSSGIYRNCILFVFGICFFLSNLLTMIQMETIK